MSNEQEIQPTDELLTFKRVHEEGGRGMSTVREMYKQIDTPQGFSILPCPCCGAEAHVWQYSESETAPTTKAIMCDNGDTIGPQDGIVGAGCLLYMPPDAFYRPTIREAVKYWNKYAQALMVLQRSNRWKTASVLRNGTEGTTHDHP